jgi:hypothetical protein
MCLNSISVKSLMFFILIFYSLTCLWAYTTLPRSFHVPPRRSIRTIRRIWKKRRPRRAVAANTWPDVPIPITISEAVIVIISELKKFKIQYPGDFCHLNCLFLPMIQNGLFKNFRRPIPPWYLDRHPDDQSLCSNLNEFVVWNTIKYLDRCQRKKEEEKIQWNWIKNYFHVDLSEQWNVKLKENSENSFSTSGENRVNM